MRSPWLVGTLEMRTSTSASPMRTVARPSCGQPALGDVELAHDLDAARDGFLDLLRHRLHVVEHAVDAVADLEPVVEGLEVDVRRPHLERLEEQHVHQLDDRRLVGDVEDVLPDLHALGERHDVGVLELPDRLLDDVLLVLVGLVDQARDLGARREHRVELAAEHRREVVHRVRVERRRRRDLHRRRRSCPSPTR